MRTTEHCIMAQVAPPHGIGRNFFPIDFPNLSFGYVKDMDVLYDSAKGKLLKMEIHFGNRPPTSSMDFNFM